MADGEGCTCAARDRSECACDADWTPRELIDARAEILCLRSDVSRRRDLEAGLMAGLARLRLTDAEREAVEWAAYAAAQWYEHTASDTLRGLLDRTATGGK
jgi:hypothetical protein